MIGCQTCRKGRRFRRKPADVRNGGQVVVQRTRADLLRPAQDLPRGSARGLIGWTGIHCGPPVGPQWTPVDPYPTWIIAEPGSTVGPTFLDPRPTDTPAFARRQLARAGAPVVRVSTSMGPTEDSNGPPIPPESCQAYMGRSMDRPVDRWNHRREFFPRKIFEWPTVATRVVHTFGWSLYCCCRSQNPFCSGFGRQGEL